MGAEVDALSFALTTIASRFPQYSFEDILDKTPAWIDWALTQVCRLDPACVTALSRFTVSKPEQEKSRSDEIQALREMGFKVTRG